MFFNEAHFKELGLSGSVLAAKLANKAIDESGQVVFGRAFDNDELEDFTNNQKGPDTHVAVIVGVKVMGSLTPRSSAIKVDTPTDKDLNNALKDRVRSLEKLLKSKEAPSGDA